jgi:hypothetical protein
MPSPVVLTAYPMAHRVCDPLLITKLTVPDAWTVRHLLGLPGIGRLHSTSVGMTLSTQLALLGCSSEAVPRCPALVPVGMSGWSKGVRWGLCQVHRCQASDTGSIRLAGRRN